MKNLLATAALAAFLAPIAHAESMTKPGLWDLSMKTTYNKGGPKISAEDLAAMKKMGIDLANMQMQRCITPQQAQEEFNPAKFGEDESGCTVVNPKTSGGRMTGEYVCNGTLKGRGVVQAQTSSEGFTSFFTFVGTSSDPMMGGGSPLDMRSDISGKFLKADCGSAGGPPPLPGAPPRMGKGFKIPGQK